MFTLGGQAMEDANIGQSLAHSGGVVVSPDSWNMCSHDKFFGSKIGKTNFMEVVHVSSCLLEFYNKCIQTDAMANVLYCRSGNIRVIKLTYY